MSGLSASQREAARQLSDLVQASWRDRVFTHLREHRRPAGSAQIAAALEAPHYTVQRALLDLFGMRRVIDAGRGPDGRPLYQAVEVGACEWCGLVSHRLVASECPACRERSTTAAGGIARPVPVSVPGFYVEVVDPACHSHSEV